MSLHKKILSWFLGVSSAASLQAFSFYPSQRQLPLLLGRKWLLLNLRVLSLIVILGSAPTYYAWYNYDSLRRQIQVAAAALPDLTAQQQQWRQRTLQLANLQSQLAVNETYLQSLLLLVQSMSAGLSLDNFEQNARGEVTMVGRAQSQASALALVTKLEAQVSSATIASLRQSGSEFEFSINIKL